MKLNILALASLVALTAAQSASTSESAATATVSLTPQEQCVKSKCSANDICCVAGCYQVPCPNGSQANDTNSCVAACPQGTGSPSDTERYASCQANCFSSHYFPITATGGSGPSKTTASSADATTTGKGSSKTGSSESGTKSASGSGTSTGTSSGSSSTTSENAAAAQLKLGASAASLAGLALGILAL